MTEDQRQANEYLLEQMRRCGLFKCTDCLYALWEDRGLGMEYRCRHPRTLPNCAWNDHEHAMSGSACDVFEPNASACENVVMRMSATSKAVSDLIAYAWSHTKTTVTGESRDEIRLAEIRASISGQGMVRP